MSRYQQPPRNGPQTVADVVTMSTKVTLAPVVIVALLLLLATGGAALTMTRAPAVPPGRVSNARAERPPLVRRGTDGNIARGKEQVSEAGERGVGWVQPPRQ